MDTNNMIDWNGKLEAVHEDGRVVQIDLRDTSKATDAQWWVQIEGRPFLVAAIDGYTGYRWTIRNKPAAAVAPAGGDEEWGPAIEVGGVRPGWLEDEDKLQFHDRDQNRWNGLANVDAGFMDQSDWWRFASLIRLPVNHPHYRTEKPAEAPLGVLTGVERVGRLEGFRKRLRREFDQAAKGKSRWGSDGAWLNGAEAIMGAALRVFEAPEAAEIDPDLLKAREICALIAEGMSDDGLATEYRRGDLDEQFEMRSALAGLRSPASDHRSK